MAVPDADKRGGSDPYCRITLLELEDGDVQTGRTQPMFNTSKPEWPHAIQLTIPSGEPPSGQATRIIEAGPLVRVSVYDKDMTTSDDVLGSAEVRLSEGVLGVERERTVTLSDPTGKFGSFDVSFKWTLSDYVPPAATLKLSNLKAFNVPNKDKKRGDKKGERSGGADPFLVFKLLECGDLIERAATAPQPNKANPVWTMPIELALPHGHSRPTLLTVFLWDDDKHDEDDPIATTDYRLGGERGSAEVDLIGIGRGHKGVKVSFDFEVVDDT